MENATEAEKLAIEELGDRSAVAAAQERQQNLINDEVKDQPLLGPKEPIASLAREYDAEKSPEFHQKATELAERYTSVRRVRGDGNCMFRAMLSAQLHRCRQTPGELARWAGVCGGWKSRAIRLGFPDFTTEDFADNFMELLGKLGGMSEEELDLLLNDEGNSNYLICFTRIVASAYLQEKAAEYEAFLEGGKTMAEFCKTDVDPMFREADHLVLQATALGFGNTAHEVGTAPPDVGPLTFLYRPGHYDILY